MFAGVLELVGQVGSYGLFFVAGSLCCAAGFFRPDIGDSQDDPLAGADGAGGQEQSCKEHKS